MRLSIALSTFRLSVSSLPRWARPGEKLWEYLRRAKKRRSHRPGRRSQQSPIPNRVFIEQRPVEAQERREVGHWESDSLLFPYGQALNVLVDRCNRFTLVTKLEGRTAEATSTVLTQRLADQPARSLTADNGSENYHHQRVSHVLDIAFFFCHPYHSWEKGTVEPVLADRSGNMNGLIRRYLPRRTDLRPITQEELDQIAHELPGLSGQDRQPSTAQVLALPDPYGGTISSSRCTWN